MSFAPEFNLGSVLGRVHVGYSLGAYVAMHHAMLVLHPLVTGRVPP